MEDARICNAIQNGYDRKACVVIEGWTPARDPLQTSRIYSVMHRQIYHKECSGKTDIGTMILYNLAHTEEHLSVEQLFAELKKAHYTPCQCELGRRILRERKFWDSLRLPLFPSQ